MSPEMESMHHPRTLNPGVDASIERSWSVTFAQFVPSALLHFRKKARRHVPEVGTWIAAKNPVCLIIKKQIYKNKSVQNDDPAVQEASLSIVVDGRLHAVHALRDLNLALPKTWSPALLGRRVLVGSYRLVADNERSCFKLALRFADSAEGKDCFDFIKEALADAEDQDCGYAVALFDSDLQPVLDSPPIAYTFPIEYSQPSDTLEFGAQSTLHPARHSNLQEAVQKKRTETQVLGSLNNSRKRSLTSSLLPGSEIQESHADKFQASILQGIGEPLHFPRHHRVVASAANAQAPQEYTAGISELHQDVCLSEVMHLQVPNHNESGMIGEVNCHKEPCNLYKDKPSPIEERIDLQRTDESMTHTAVQPSQEFEDPLSSQAGPAGNTQSIDFRRQLLDCILDPSFRTLVKEVENILLELETTSHTDVIAKLLEC